MLCAGGRNRQRDDSSRSEGALLLVNERVYNVLFLCTGNSARSIIADALLNARGEARFRAFSAGSHPAGAVNPLVLAVLRDKGLATESLHSKSWDEFATPDAPQMELVITVCDQAAGGTCPIWPGHPAMAHWPAPDPAAWMHQPDQARKLVDVVFELMERRIARLTSLPLGTLDAPALQREVRAIAAST